MRRVGMLVLFLALATPALAEQIRFGDGGSIFGGATWTITPNDHVRYDAYQIDGGLSTRQGWVWDNPDVKQGHITFSIPGAFATAAAIAREGLADIGATPAFQTPCNDAGSLIMEVATEGVAYAGSLDHCAGQDGAPSEARAHYVALSGVQAEIVSALGLDRLAE
ncbi:MAG: hypothetical protein MUD11_15305 [Rhodobacteraceae bacterium]|nr:hypothetical protein [Paracoccaceae bacterium]